MEHQCFRHTKYFSVAFNYMQFFEFVMMISVDDNLQHEMDESKSNEL